MISQIKYLPNEYLEKINYLVSCNKMIYAYGAGVMGTKLASILGRYGVCLQAFVVDDMYYTEKKSIWVEEIGKNIPVISYTDFIKQGGENIVLSAIELRNQHVEEQFEKVMKKFPNSKVIDFEHINFWNCEAIDYYFFLQNYERFKETYNQFEDELSKKTFVAFVNACIAENSRELDSLCPEEYYQYDYDYDLLLSNECKTIVECGAFDGKTAVQLAEYAGDGIQIIALEPDDNCYQKLISRVKQYPQVKTLKYGAGAKAEAAYIILGENGTSSIVSEEQIIEGVPYTKIELKKIDELFANQKIDSIIMDVEGSEMDALHGAFETIRKNIPSLGIRIYHKKEDLITIPQYIDSLFDKKVYKYYLRKNTLNRGYMDTTFYAIPAK